MNDHKEENWFHSLNQSKFIKKHSTEIALMCIVNVILWAMDNKMCVTVVMLDLSAGFDTVSHTILFRHLKENFDVTGNDIVLLWLK